MFRKIVNSLTPTLPTTDGDTTSNQQVRNWVRRYSTLNGIFWGLIITMIVGTTIRDRLPHDSRGLSPSGYLQGFALVSIAGIPLGIFLSRRLAKWTTPLTDTQTPPPEMPSGQFRMILLCLDIATLCCVVGSFAYRWFPIVPRFIYGIAMTLSICFSLGVLLLAAWAAVLQPSRDHLFHIALGTVMVGATAFLWMTLFQPT